jgi:hypothetical protein
MELQAVNADKVLVKKGLRVFWRAARELHETRM